MAPSSPGNYLETEVLTAPPQKLQLMLIEAVIRFAKRAKMQWEAGNDGDAYESIFRAKKVVAELLGGLNREESPKLAAKISAVYVYVLRALTTAAADRDVSKIDDALKVLAVEQETWQQVCRKLVEEKSPPYRAPAFIRPHDPSADVLSAAAGFSFEA